MDNAMSNVDKSKIEQYAEQLLDWLMGKVLDIALAMVFIFVGMKLCKILLKVIKKSFAKSGLESSVAGFLISLIRGILYIVIFIMGAAIMGFQVTSLVTILGTASLAIGLALQGSLANFAGGVLILIMKPFRVGDYIIQNVNGCEGIVTSIDIFYTKLKTIDNKVIVIPNGNITSGSITNVTAENDRRLDLIVNVSYDSDLKTAKEILNSIAYESEYVNKSQKPIVYVDSLGEYSVSLGLRFYVPTDKYWDAKWDTLEKIKMQFDDNNIMIPHKRLDVVLKEKSN